MTRRTNAARGRDRFGRLAVLGLAIAAVLLPGCGADESIIAGDEVERVVEPEASEVITVWHTYSDVETRTFEQEVIPAFEAEHPDIRVLSVKHAYEYFKGSLIAETTSGAGPDVVRMDIVWLPEFARLGLIDPIDTYPELPGVTKRLLPSALESGKYEGRHYGLPLNINTKAAIYSRELLRKAGLEKPPETMDELVALAERTGYQLGVNGINTWAVLPYFVGLGGQLTNKDYTKASGYLDGPASARAVHTLRRLIESDIVSGDVLSGKLERWQAVQDGKLLMMDEGPWYYTILANVEGYDYARLKRDTLLAPFPHNPGTKGSIIGGENLVLMRNSRNKQAAWTFMKWMTDVEAQRLMFKTGLLPTNAEASDSKETYSPTIRPYVESLDASFLRPPVANWAKIDQAFNEMFERMLHGRVPVEVGLGQLAKQIDEWLEE
ncbi:extracellular solute-binding protein [Cohnella hongkongensis]|uniref:Extracellular solute-binding protein n=1 Tax=Cohnella hongkongensis TaxID=178337 RepID=A0ABV9F582_9BACL